MKSSAQWRTSTATLATSIFAGGLVLLIGCAIYILTQGNSTRAALPLPVAQTPTSQPTPPMALKATTGSQLIRTQPSFITPQAARRAANQQTSTADATLDDTPDDTIVEINDVALSKRTLQIVLDADQAMALLLNTTIPVDHTAALERLINGELVRQAAQPTGFTLAEATIQQSLLAFLTANQKNEADLERALLGASLTRAEFIDYFSRLLLIDSFVRKEATQRKVTDAAYLQQLQEAAHISFGPAAAFSLHGTVDIPRSPNPATASDAVPFALPLLNDTRNQTLTLNSLLGHPTVLSFWTTWCPYCKKQLPLLVTAHAQYAQQGIQFVGIAVKDSPASVQTYIAENQIRYPIPLDADGRVANTYNVHGFPTTLFLDAQGHVVARQIGALTTKKLREEIQQLLKNSK